MFEPPAEFTNWLTNELEKVKALSNNADSTPLERIAANHRGIALSEVAIAIAYGTTETVKTQLESTFRNSKDADIV